MEQNDFKSGYIAIAGPPNAGKSTLLNFILGEKISITSKKPQTTRNRILGILHKEASQFIFVDTPGVHYTKKEFNARMVDEAISVMGDADVILLVIDVKKRDVASEQLIMRQLKDEKRPVVLALNKIDLVKKQDILPIINEMSEKFNFAVIIPLSAKMGMGVSDLVSVMESFLPNGPLFFPKESITDVSERFIVAEMIREKVFRLTGQEIPYSTAVTIESFTRKNKNLVVIFANIYVERDSQKGIIIGKKGEKLKNIGEEARKDIEVLLGANVYLKLYVRVQKNWSSDTKAMKRFGY